MKRIALLALLGALLTPTLPVRAAPAARTAAARAPEMYEYVAVDGDTLTSISARFLDKNAGWQQLLRYNKFANPDHINPGERIRIPVELMQREPAGAATVGARGDAQVLRGGAATPLAPGAALAQGDEVRTGKDGYVTIRLADGSVLRLPPESQIRFDSVEKIRDTAAVRSVFRLVAGRVESLVARFRGSGNRFEVTTEQATTGVRGTDFRVAVEAGATASEVLDGTVAFEGAGAASGKGARLEAGFGSKASGDGQLLAPVKLLDAPQAPPLPLQERLVVRFEFPALPGAVKYRAQVGRDRDFYDVLAETLVTTPNLRFAGLDDGPYFLRVRGIDANGLEGRDTVMAFTLKARPEPPLISLPADKGKVRGTPVDFAWANVGSNAKYRVQVARDAAFTQLVFEPADTGETKLASPATLALGEYYWRIRTLEGADTGPWSDVRSFRLLAPPPAPEPPSFDGKRIKFSWTGEPGQTFIFQVARDSKFATLVFEEKLTEPALDKPQPRSGTYYMRYRAIDADGFEGPFTAPQRFAIDPPKVSGASNAFSADE